MSSFQKCLGFSANTFLLFFHIPYTLLNCRPKPRDLLTCHLALIHIRMLLTSVDFLPLDMFESLHFGNDFKCKSPFYTNRAMRGLSICSICLLSMLQAVSLSPSTSWLARFKHKSTNYIMHVFFFWVFFNLSFSSWLIFFSVHSSNTTHIKLLNVSKSCSLSPMNSTIRGMFFTVTLSKDVSCVVLMLLSSAYMVILLSRPSPEKRATQTILLLVSFFVVVHWVDFIFSIFLTLLWTYDPYVVLIVQGDVLNAYATISPLVQIIHTKFVFLCLPYFT
uniref:Vomeronasal type-1 receptor n=1 Tax=Piliocolobus tephrosceles TaxID=591936 RepID=A0A8C9I0M8_9PRIM